MTMIACPTNDQVISAGLGKLCPWPDWFTMSVLHPRASCVCQIVVILVGWHISYMKNEPTIFWPSRIHL